MLTMQGIKNFTDSEATDMAGKNPDWAQQDLVNAIEEGDFIWVPPVVRKPTSYWLAVIGQTTSIISVALSIVLLVIQLKK